MTPETQNTVTAEGALNPLPRTQAKGGRHAPVSRAGCTVNEGYENPIPSHGKSHENTGERTSALFNEQSPATPVGKGSLPPQPDRDIFTGRLVYLDLKE